ncbi:MAG: hypothetical protein C4523_04440 [Myxococcales bacterium]|nr:MAG: hypothetical protein C4523_04440 [Myxococcales bacterium]
MAEIDNDQIAARIFLYSALPLTKVVAEDKPLFRKLFPKKGVVQFCAKGSDIAAHMIFDDGALDVKKGFHEKPDLTLSFPTLAKMNGFFAGKTVLPRPKGLRHLHLLFRILPLLLTLKLLLPSALPKDTAKKTLKVKLVLYMITNALSQLNKAGDPQMTKVTKTSPDRIFQWTVENGGPAAYLRMKGGRTKAGRGTYERRRPFVHMLFPDIDGAMKVLTSQAPLVDAVRLGWVRTEGAMEYSKEIGLQMQRIEEITTSY